MSSSYKAHNTKKFLAAAVLMLIITAAAVIFIQLRADYLVLYNADTGERYLTEKAEQGFEFSVEFIHSVNKTPVKDTYRIDEGKIRAYSTTYRSFGAGVQTQLEEGQKMTVDKDGNMIITGFDITYDPLRYIVSAAYDHVLFIGDRQISLRETCGKNTRVVFEVAPLFEILTKGLT